MTLHASGFCSNLVTGSITFLPFVNWRACSLDTMNGGNADISKHNFALEELSTAIRIRTTICFLFFLFLELVALVLSLFRRQPATFKNKRNKGFSPKKNLLQKWHDEENREPLYGRQTSIRFSDKFDMFRLLFINSLFEGAWYVSSIIVVLNWNLEHYAHEAKEVFRRVRINAENSPRYKKRFENLILYLRDIEDSSPEEIADFIYETACRTLKKSCGWVTIAQNQMRTAFERNEYQLLGAMATLELFYREDISYEVFYLKGYWSCPGRMSKRVQNILFSIVYDRVGVHPSEEDRQKQQYHGVEVVLLSKLDKPFRRIFTPYMLRESPMYRMGTLWEMLLNHYGQFMEENWSTSTLERIEWALQYGRQYISKKKYEILSKQNRKTNLNLRSMDVRTLIVFSVSGMIEFSGFDSCIFRLTAVPEAKVKLSGYLPIPTMLDLVELGLAECVYKNTFRMHDFPASASKHKGVQTGDRILVCKSSANEKFSARLSTRIAWVFYISPWLD